MQEKPDWDAVRGSCYAGLERAGFRGAELDDRTQEAVSLCWRRLQRNPSAPVALSIHYAVRDAIRGRSILREGVCFRRLDAYFDRGRIAKMKERQFQRRAALALVDAD